MIEPLDDHDRDQLTDLLDSEGYKLASERIQKTIADKQAELERAKTWDDAARCQGFIAGLRTAADIPKILMQQCDQNHKEKRG